MSGLLPVERVLRRRHDDPGAAPEEVVADHPAVVLGEGVLVLSKSEISFKFGPVVAKSDQIFPESDQILHFL